MRSGPPARAAPRRRASRRTRPGRLRLWLLPGAYVVCRLSPRSRVPPWVAWGEFTSITRTSEELSIICSERVAPRGARRERGWRCLMVEGPFDLSAVGVAASLTAPLARARVSLLLISTYDTDYVLVKEADLDRAFRALAKAGHDVAR